MNISLDADKALQGLADRLDVSVEVLWSALVQQAHISFHQDLVAAVLALLLATGFFILAWACVPGKDEEDFNEHMNSAFMLAAIGLAVFLLSLLIFRGAATARFNPEFWALQWLLENLPR